MRALFLGLAALLSITVLAMAKGTPAGTLITNQAQIDYVVGNTPGQIASNEDRFVIDRVVDVRIDWQDSAPIEVSPSDAGRVLTFRVTNQGNGDENITMTYEHNLSSDFAPTSVHIVRDTNGNGIYDPGVDLNITGALHMGADANATLFIVGDIPASTAPGDQSHDGLRAQIDANASIGADRQNAVDTVIRRKTDTDAGVWIVRDYWLVARKSLTLHSRDHAAHTGTRITYTIECFIDGNATGRTITGVTVRDTVPVGTRYVPGSLRLNNTTLTDAVDGDAGQYDANASRVEVRMGTLSGTTHTKVRFDVEVK